MDPIDKILLTDDRIAPSSGFQSRVMDAVIADEHKRPPLPFPWGRFGVGVAACLLWAVAGGLVMSWIDWSVFAPAVSAIAFEPAMRFAAAATFVSLVVVAIPRLRNTE
jgi:hypothetical protein